MVTFFFFFFQAEDGIRDFHVTGVQTCALPISGEDGLRRALTVPYDVVVLDLQLPGLDGLTVLRYLLSARPAQAVIASSCRSDPATKSECLCAGARAFLAKPFSLTDLLASVADALASSPFSRAGGQALSPARLGPG